MYDGLPKDQQAWMPCEDPKPDSRLLSTLLMMFSTKIMT